MKLSRSLIAVALLLVLCLSLAACGADQEDLVGTWSGSWSYNGNEFTETFTLYEDFSYQSTMYKNGQFHQSESGTYEFAGDRLELHPYGEEGHSTPYTFENGKLVNNGHEMRRQ